MKHAIRAHLRDFLVVLGLIVLGVAIGGYLLSQQRFRFPLLEDEPKRVEIELQNAQSVQPGQGQTVRVVGVEIGQISAVEIDDGVAVVEVEIDQEFDDVIREDATALLRPRTGLKDMLIEVDPGQGEVLPDGGRIAVANTLPDVNPDEVLSTLDGDTRPYLRILLHDAGTALRDDGGGEDGQGAPADLRETFKRFEPTARDGKRLTQALAERRRNIKRAIHSFQQISTELATRDEQLAQLVDSANENFSAFADEEAALREALQLFPGALSQTATTLRDVDALAAELGPALEGLRPFARELAPSLRRQRPFLRETTPIIRDQVRPFARDVQPTVRDLRTATEDLAPVSPRLPRSFKVLN